jgi:hypothetical protein
MHLIGGLAQERELLRFHVTDCAPSSRANGEETDGMIVAGNGTSGYQKPLYLSDDG